jgi:hypothetical protein
MNLSGINFAAMDFRAAWPSWVKPGMSVSKLFEKLQNKHGVSQPTRYNRAPCKCQ